MQLTTLAVFTSVLIYAFTSAIGQSIDWEILPVPCSDNIICGDGKPHYMCEPQPKSCKPFQLLKLSRRDIHSFLLSHNGIRNRMAHQYRIANMNIVHWSPRLQQRAEMFLRKCQVESDTCQNVGPPETQVNGNSYLHHEAVSRNWPAHLVRLWFNEFGYKETWDNFHTRRSQGKVGNYSQLIYPLVQFIGCSGALVPSGHQFICYYWPRANDDYEHDFTFGQPCSHCNPHLPACSRIFSGLCGIDTELQESKAMGMTKAFNWQKLFESSFLILLLNWKWYLD